MNDFPGIQSLSDLVTIVDGLEMNFLVWASSLKGASITDKTFWMGLNSLEVIAHISLRVSYHTRTCTD